MEAPAPPPGIRLAPARPYPAPPTSSPPLADPPPPAWPRPAQAAAAGLLAVSLALLGWHAWTLQRGATRPTLLVAGDAEELPSVNGSPARGGTKAAPAEPLDLNEASTAQLEKLPRIGPQLARRIVEARRERPFASVDDLRRVRGIGPRTLEGLRPFVRVGPALP